MKAYIAPIYSRSNTKVNGTVAPYTSPLFIGSSMLNGVTGLYTDEEGRVWCDYTINNAMIINKKIAELGCAYSYNPMCVFNHYSRPVDAESMVEYNSTFFKKHILDIVKIASKFNKEIAENMNYYL